MCSVPCTAVTGHQISGTGRDFFESIFARDASRSPNLVIMRRLQIALFAVLIGLGSSTVYAASQPSVSGLVRDSAGMPQIGAAVQLLRPDMSVVATVYTSVWEYSVGRYLKGFADAIVPEASDAEQKVEAILASMRVGPPRL